MVLSQLSNSFGTELVPSYNTSSQVKFSEEKFNKVKAEQTIQVLTGNETSPTRCPLGRSRSLTELQSYRWGRGKFLC